MKLKLVKSLALGAMLVGAITASSSVFAAAAAVEQVPCTGMTVDHKTIEVTMIYDEATPAKAEAGIAVKIDAVDVATFPASTVSASYVNVGTEASPFMNRVVSGKDGANMIDLRYPEQDPDADTISIYMTLDAPAAGVSLEEIELSCPNK